jgi:phosphoribosylanthranilate isomerase
MTTLVKICGICDVEGGIAAAEAGADLLGFHFCDSRRRLTPEEALRIIEELPEGPALVGVFIDQPPVEVEAIADYCGLDLVQLHGSEPPGFPIEVPLIKVLKVKDGKIPDHRLWPDDLLMLDSWSADQRGGTGRTWDWDIAVALVQQREMFIAGGLNPDNVGDVVRRLNPYAVDVSSGVESEPRVKDPAKVARFVAAAKRELRVL